MKRFLIITIFIASSWGYNAEPITCQYLLDEPFTICNEDNIVMTITPHEMSSFSSICLDEMDIGHINSTDMPFGKVDTLIIHPGDNDNVTPMNLTSELFDKIDAEDLIVERVNFSITPKPFSGRLQSVKRINWINNVLENFPGDIFDGFLHLKSLQWVHPALKTISPELFSKINKNLEELRINSSITIIKPYSFRRFKKLTLLLLVSAELDLLRPDMFNGLDNLRDLQLRFCGIKTIESNTFHGLPLRTLDLGFNNISNIGPEIFHNLKFLRNVYLNNNMLQAIPSELLRSTRNLRQLNLNSNQIEVIRAGTFKKLSNVWAVDLGNNQISDIEPGAFANSHMRYLNLENNAIKVLHNNMFHGLYLKKFINLKGNHITEIESCALRTIRVNKQNSITIKMDNIHNFPGVLSYKWRV